MAQGDGAPADVEDLPRDAELLPYTDTRGGERLIVLDQIELIELHPGPVHQFPHARDRREHHVLRFHGLEQKSRIVPSGSTPISRALRSLISTVALAPSEIWDELPAVSTPSFLNTGGSFAKASRVVSGRIPPSRFTVTSLPSTRVSTGTISFATRPDSVALFANDCERRAYSSHISRVSPKRSAMISPPMAMWKSL